MATRAVPAREYTAPFVCIECAPTKTVETSEMTEPRAGSRTYVHCMPASERTAINRLPEPSVSIYVREEMMAHTL